jgi:hypothetical protein
MKLIPEQALKKDHLIARVVVIYRGRFHHLVTEGKAALKNLYL